MYLNYLNTYIVMIMKKFKVIIFLFIMILSQLWIIDFCNSIYLNKEIINNDLRISQITEMNNSYDIIYNPTKEITSIQCKVFDKNDKIIWNSTKIIEIGKVELKEINFDSLELLMKESDTYYLKVLKTYYHFESKNSISCYIDIIEIK